MSLTQTKWASLFIDIWLFPLTIGIKTDRSRGYEDQIYQQSHRVKKSVRKVRKTGEAVKSVKHNKQKLRDRQQGKGNHNQDESWDEVKSHLTRHTGIRNTLQLTSRLNTTKSEMKDHFLVEEYISVPLYPAATHDASSFST